MFVLCCVVVCVFCVLCVCCVYDVCMLRYVVLCCVCCVVLRCVCGVCCVVLCLCCVCVVLCCDVCCAVCMLCVCCVVCCVYVVVATYVWTIVAILKEALTSQSSGGRFPFTCQIRFLRMSRAVYLKVYMHAAQHRVASRTLIAIGADRCVASPDGQNLGFCKGHSYCFGHHGRSLRAS